MSTTLASADTSAGFAEPGRSSGVGHAGQTSSGPGAEMNNRYSRGHPPRGAVSQGSAPSSYLLGVGHEIFGFTPI